MVFVSPPTRKHESTARLLCATLLVLVTLGAGATHAQAQVEIPTEFINVNSFIGDASERIEAALEAAANTDHKTVFFPNGTYALRSVLGLNQGTNTEIHLIGQSRDGVHLVPDTSYLEANYDGGSGARLAHMINLGGSTVFDSVDVSIQNMTIDMRHPDILGVDKTYNVAGHGIRVAQGWDEGQFTVNEITIRNTGGYGIGIQDRGGHPKNNMTLTNLHIERTGLDGIDTKEAGGDGNRNLVIRNLSVNDIGLNNGGDGNAIDVRYRDSIIENVNLVQGSTNGTGINFRSFEAGYAGIVGFDVSDVYVRGFNTGMILSSNNATHQNIAISDFYIEGQSNSAIGSSGTNHSGHTISDGFVNPDFGGFINVGSNATVTNVARRRRDPALTPTTDTTFESNVSLAGDTFSPAWEGIVGSERVSLNPTASGAGPFEFTVGNTGVFQVDFDTQFNVMDKLIVEGTINLGGEFRVNLIGGSPLFAGQHRVIDAHAITGSFDQITLPTAGLRLTWNTSLLETQGIIELTGPNFLLLGDQDNFSYNSADDDLPVDPDFAALIGGTAVSMDQTDKNRRRLVTFDLGGPLSEEVEEAWIELRLRELSGFENDFITIEELGRTRSIASLTELDRDGSNKTVIYNLQEDELAMLSDGIFNIAITDDHALDWAGLAWTTVPEPSSVALVTVAMLTGGWMLRRRIV